MQNAEEYAEIILRDEREKIISETPTVYETHRIERIYQFEDGAIVKYEWQESSSGRIANNEIYNHRFTLTTLPTPNPNKFEKGIIKVINYPQV